MTIYTQACWIYYTKILIIYQYHIKLFPDNIIYVLSFMNISYYQVKNYILINSDTRYMACSSLRPWPKKGVAIWPPTREIQRPNFLMLFCPQQTFLQFYQIKILSFCSITMSRFVHLDLYFKLNLQWMLKTMTKIDQDQFANWRIDNMSHVLYDRLLM